MASGKLAITYICEDLVGKSPDDLPLVRANPDTIYARLKELLLDPALRRDVEVPRRGCVGKHHALKPVRVRLMEI